MKKWSIPKNIKGQSLFCNILGSKRRIFLERSWKSETPFECKIIHIGMNPSLADSHFDDPTVRKEYLWSKQNGYTHYIKLNVCDVIDAVSKNLKNYKRACSNKNYNFIKKYLLENNCNVVLAWGKLNKSLQKYSKKIIKLLVKYNRKVYCWKQNLDGSPMHPLYLSPNKMKLSSINWGTLK